MKSYSLVIISIASTLALLLHFTTARDSGIESILTQKAADYFNGKLISILRNEFTSSSIPGFSRSGGTIYNINLGALNIGSSSIRMNPSGISFTLSSISVSGSANWKYKKWFFRTSGSVSIHVSGSISITLTAAENNRRPDFDITYCTPNTDISVRFRGGLFSWLLNLFRRYIGNKVEEYLEGNTCRIIRNELNKQETRLVNSYPIVLPIGNVLKLDIGLMTNPRFGHDFLQMPISGLSSDLLTSDDLDLLAQQYSSGPLTSGVETNRMLFFRFKPHTLNAALLAYHRANSFDTVWDITDFSDAILSVIDIGAIESNDSGLCGNESRCSIKIRVYAPDAPTIDLETDNITAMGTAIVDISLVTPKPRRTITVLKIFVEGKLCGSLSAEQRESELFTKVQVTCASVRTIRVDLSPISGFNASQVTDMINELINQMLPVANAYLDKGVLIQQPGSYTIKELVINVMSDYLEVGANLIYNNWG